MPPFTARAALLASIALLPLPDVASAQDATQDTAVLPQITVRAPSPIVRRAQPQRPAAGGTARAPAQVTVTPIQAPLLGGLPIVSDQFATVTVVPREEIARSPGTTLGDLLFSKPGITGSSFAPGGASRPIVRGLDVNRVGIVDNGIGGGGVSDLGEDHFVPVDPLSTDRVEVIRGPATLRYGSQSIGGVVSASNNRIPEAMPCSPAIAMSKGCAQFETRAAWSSVDNGIEGAQIVDVGAREFRVPRRRVRPPHQGLSHPELSLSRRSRAAGHPARRRSTAGSRTQAPAPTAGRPAARTSSPAAMPVSR